MQKIGTNGDGKVAVATPNRRRRKKKKIRYLLSKRYESTHS